jgi:glycosyltransferase involved in cell wall biosynthesis
VQPNLGTVLSVVVPAWNAAGVLPGLLAALSQQTGDHELVVVDARSDDGTAALAAAAGAHVVTAPRRNRSLARNLGVAAAEGDLVAFTDADCVPVPGWVAALEDCLQAAPLAAGPVRIQTSKRPSAAERFDVLWRYPQERYVEAGVATSANLGIHRDAFEVAGRYDPRFHHGEDTDLCLRAADAGLRVAWCADAEVAHPAARGLREVARRGFEHGASARRLARVYPDRSGRRYWTSPGGLLRRGAALRALSVETVDDRGVELAARIDYGARMAGSLWAEVVRRSVR